MLAAVIVVCLVAAVVCLVFAFLALFRDPAAIKNVQDTAKKLNEVAADAAPVAAGKTPGADAALKDQSTAQMALAGGLTDYVKALAELATSLSKLRQGVAGIFMAFALLGLAGGLAAIDDKVDDKQPAAKTKSKSVPVPAGARTTTTP